MIDVQPATIFLDAASLLKLSSTSSTGRAERDRMVFVVQKGALMLQTVAPVMNIDTSRGYLVLSGLLFPIIPGVTTVGPKEWLPI